MPIARMPSFFDALLAGDDVPDSFAKPPKVLAKTLRRGLKFGGVAHGAAA